MTAGCNGTENSWRLCVLCTCRRVGEVVLLLFFEMLLEKRLTRSNVSNFQGHTMHGVEMVAV